LKYTYDKASATYQKNGKAVPRETVRADAEYHALVTSNQLKSLTRKALRSGMAADDFEEKFAAILKRSHIQAGVAGRGGKDNTHLVHYGAIGRELKEQYRLLRGFTGDLLDGRLTEKQALARAKQYGSSTLKSFGVAELSATEESRLDEGRRSLTPGVKHCERCRGHVTLGYVPIAEIVAIGADCYCGGNCRCVITFRRAGITGAGKQQIESIAPAAIDAPATTDKQAAVKSTEAPKAKAESTATTAQAKPEKAEAATKASAEKATNAAAPQPKVEDEARFSGGMKSRPVIKEDLERALSRQMRAAAHHSDLLHLERSRGTSYEQRAQSKADRSSGSFHNALSKLKPGVSLEILDNNIWINKEVTDSLAKEGARGLAVTKDGQLAASASYQIKKNYIEVDYLAAAPRSMFEGGQGGSGRAMIEALVAESRQQGFGGELRLAALESAEGFYKKMGFKRIRGPADEAPRYKLSKEAAAQHYRD
jgi:N-acetylglutamate synthase-like GNAT family acetyltransferase